MEKYGGLRCYANRTLWIGAKQMVGIINEN
jgi:hypothetical protein